MYDIVIKGGIVVDTERLTCTYKNIGICGDKIAYVGTEDIEGIKLIDASDKYVCPGFIDVHSHVDGDAYAGMLSACQGITTAVCGNCGLSPVDIKSYFESQKMGYCMNQLMFVGHSFSLRAAVGLTDPYAQANDAQLSQMVCLAKKALDDGACGISFGLDYSPGASLREVRTLSELCAEYGRIASVHTRLFTDKDLNSLYEVIGVAKSIGIRLLVSHFVYQYGNGMMREALGIVDRARSEGVDVYIDSGLYTDWSTYIGTETYSPDVIRDNGYVFGDFVVATGRYAGKRMNREIYEYMREHEAGESVICFTGKKEEIYMALKQSYAMPSTDAGAYAKGEGHPQIAGTFPKYFIEMVRERRDFDMAEAVYKSSTLPAKIFGLTSKGSLRCGMDADIVVVDLENLVDRAAFPHLGRPDATPEGIDTVIVSGGIVVDHGCFTDAKSGRCISLHRCEKINK